MATGVNGNGLSGAEAYDERTVDASPMDQLASADFNAVQDGIIDVSAALDEAKGEICPSRRATCNDGDSPLPTQDGGVIVWFEVVTNGTTPVTIDNNIDWRDRWVEVSYFVALAASSPQPGDALDYALQGDLQSDSAACHRLFYSGAGNDGTHGLDHGAYFNPSSGSLPDSLNLHAKATGGGLAIMKNATTAGDYILFGCAKASPPQNHH